MKAVVFVGVVASLILLTSCSAGTGPLTSVAPDIVTGRVVGIENTVPRDGSALILSLLDNWNQPVAVSVRGANRGYQPTELEEEIFRTAMSVRVGDVIEVRLSDGWVSSLRIR